MAGASQASAAIWFAAPHGDGPAPCVQSDPCDIYEAVGNAPDGNRIAALAGAYAIGSRLQVGDGIVLQGPYSGPPAVLSGDGSAGPAVVAAGDGTRVTDFEITQSSLGDGVAVADGAVGDRLDSSTSGSGAACAPAIGGLLRDSLCVARGGGNGVMVDQGEPGSGTAELTNVTAVSSGDGATAAALLVRAGFGAELEVEATNVIARAMGDAPDVVSGALAGWRADLTLADSNYDDAVAPRSGHGHGTRCTNGNQTTEPVFTNAPGGDFTEAAGSPTIDAGSSQVPSLGLLDIGRRARIGDGSADIGAYEFVPPPDTRAPNVSIPVAPKGRIKTTRRYVDLTFELASDEPDVVFECKINRLPAEACTSPVTYRLEATRGVGDGLHAHGPRHRCRRQSQRQGDPAGQADSEEEALRLSR